MDNPFYRAAAVGRRARPRLRGLPRGAGLTRFVLLPLRHIVVFVLLLPGPSPLRLLPAPRLSLLMSSLMPLWRAAPAWWAGLLVCAVALPGVVRAQALPVAAPAASAPLPVTIEADAIQGTLGREAVASGQAEFRQGALRIGADTLRYDMVNGVARATGAVTVNRDGDVFTGKVLQLDPERFEGFFDAPTYFFSRTQAGGSAQRIEFVNDHTTVAQQATYSSCLPDGTGAPAWLLSARRVRMDFEANEGLAEGAVLRFYGVPLLAAPVLSFPVTAERKSGWLPPSIYPFDSRNGFQLQVPYYWNIAPHRDATLIPGVTSRRGLLLGGEFRYLEAQYEGVDQLTWLPHDLDTGRARYGLDLSHQASLRGEGWLDLRVRRVSDDSYWKDFARTLDSVTPRLLLSQLAVERPLGAAWTAYARAMRWQLAQDSTAPLDAPYERSPQIGVRYAAQRDGGLTLALQTEFNRFTNPVGLTDPGRITGSRLHALGSVSQSLGTAGWTLTPRLAFNAASYALDQPLSDGRRSASRLIPSLSLDSKWMLERQAQWLGMSLHQTLEPRLLYVRTPYRDQSILPNFDAAAKDFNFDSIYTDNDFSGVDRVSDSHRISAGVTTRWLREDSGEELLRLGVVQRYRLSDQRVTTDGVLATQRFSDVLLAGSTRVLAPWYLDAAAQYSPDQNVVQRSVVSARYNPQPFHTVSATYRLTHALSEQLELGWQWPLYGRPPSGRGQPADARECQGTLLGVGRLNYSLRDSRFTDSLVGLEYDAGCWIGRVVAERLSTGTSEATTRLLLQLELVGLSRLNVGSNPLQVLKDNVPGYQLLRDRDAPVSAP